MNEQAMCDRKELLVGYLYDELDAGDKRTFEAHLRSCLECRAELPALKLTRGQMLSWAPPEPDFGFRIVRGAAAPPAAPRFRLSPAWGMAAAAVLVMAAAAAISNVEIKYGSDGLMVRTGWNHPADPAVTAAGVVPVAAGVEVAPAAWKDEVATLDRRLRELETASHTPSPVVQASAGPHLSDAEVLRRVREMLSQSEARQQHELVLRVRQVIQDFDARRRTDMATIQQGFGQLQSATGIEAAQHREMMNTLVKYVSQQK